MSVNFLDGSGIIPRFSIHFVFFHENITNWQKHSRSALIAVCPMQKIREDCLSATILPVFILHERQAALPAPQPALRQWLPLSVPERIPTRGSPRCCSWKGRSSPARSGTIRTGQNLHFEAPLLQCANLVKNASRKLQLRKESFLPHSVGKICIPHEDPFQGAVF